MTSALQRKANIALLVTKALLLGTIAFFALWTFVISPPPTANPLVIFIVQIFMLVVFVPGVLKGNPRTCAWLCFVLLVYFCGSVLYLMSGEQSDMGLVQLLLNVGLFTSAMMYIRWQGKARKEAQGIAD